MGRGRELQNTPDALASRQGNWRRLLIAALLAVFLYELIRTAWLIDDAAITLRTVLNFLHGYGPRFNIDERVQAYTHPLWFLLLSGLSWVTGNVFTATFAASIGLSFVGLLLLCRLAVQARALALAASLLMLSKAYVDFATSGLENPLSHVLLLAAYMLAASCEDLKASAWRVRGFFIAVGLIYLTRPDLALLAAPLACWVAWHRRRQPLALTMALLAGALPVLCWTVFSLYYYGFPFPNTAYAKLGAGIEHRDLLAQGGRYFLYTLKTDPLTFFGIAAGLVLAWRQGAAVRLLALGTLLYLGYIACIGGDFMGGRFFTAPLLAAAIIMARHAWHPVAAGTAGAIVLGLGTLTLGGTLLSGRDYSDQTLDAGIANERGHNYRFTSLLTAKINTFTPSQWQAGDGLLLTPAQWQAGHGRPLVDVTCGMLGFRGVLSGPGTHWLDTCALADPLLARLPARFDPNWRIGHFERQIPTDYVESLQRDQNLLTDPKTHAFYEVIRLITRGELNDPRRWQAIVDMNLGGIPVPDWMMYRFQPIPHSTGRWPQTISVERLNRIVEGAPSYTPGLVHFDRLVAIELPKPIQVHTIDISVDNNDVYELYVLQGDHYEKIAAIDPGTGSGLVRHIVAPKPGLQPTDRLMVLAKGGDSSYVLGRLLVQ